MWAWLPLVAGMRGVCTVTKSTMGQMSFRAMDSTLNLAASSAGTIGSNPTVCEYVYVCEGMSM